MPGILLDTHALYWLVSGTEALSEAALIAIGESQQARKLYVSPITAWELSLAVRKSNKAPQLGDASVGSWFRDAIRVTEAKIAPIQQSIAIEAADIVTRVGHKDPGDCYLIATARVRKIALVSRDATIKEIALSGYLDFIEC